MRSFDPSCPVLIGTGQHTWKDRNASRTPLDALAQASSTALQDTGVDAIPEAIDCIATVRFVADTDPSRSPIFPRNPGAGIAERLRLAPKDIFQGPTGGNSPQFLVNQLAQKLSAGECSVALLAGTELLSTFFSALKSGADLSAWSDGTKDAPAALGYERDGLNEVEKTHGLLAPINTYPLFENALRHHEQRSFGEHQRLLGELCSEMSRVASNNPLAWRQDFLTAEQVCEVSPSNRMVGYPYTKAMNAVLSVDMAAAIIMTTAGKALELGIDADRLVYLRAGVDVNEIWNLSERENLYSSPAIGKAASAALNHAGLALAQIDCFDIYSCFPSAIEIACREIGISPLDPRGITVTGGLPYFGGPGNNYALHAIAETAKRLRLKEAAHGLVTGNGLYLTKHSVGIYSSQPPSDKWLPFDNQPLQNEIDQGPRTQLDANYEGEVTIETFTVTHEKDGPKEGIVIARTNTGQRVITNTGDHIQTLEQLLAKDPIGRSGHINQRNGRATFRF